MYCMPVIKTEPDRLALRKAATSGEACYSLAPIPRPSDGPEGGRERGAGLVQCAGRVETYARVFEEEGALDKLEAFASLNGPSTYRLPLNDGTVTLERSSWTAHKRSRSKDRTSARWSIGGETIEWGWWRISCSPHGALAYAGQPTRITQALHPGYKATSNKREQQCQSMTSSSSEPGNAAFCAALAAQEEGASCSCWRRRPSRSPAATAGSPRGSIARRLHGFEDIKTLVRT